MPGRPNPGAPWSRDALAVCGGGLLGLLLGVALARGAAGSRRNSNGNPRAAGLPARPDGSGWHDSPRRESRGYASSGAHAALGADVLVSPDGDGEGEEGDERAARGGGAAASVSRAMAAALTGLGAALATPARALRPGSAAAARCGEATPASGARRRLAAVPEWGEAGGEDGEDGGERAGC
jgi:hypothetical protein